MDIPVSKETRHTFSRFSERVITIACSIPPGMVMTYGDIARYAGGGSMSAQSITTILARADTLGLYTIPFHRIVYAQGRVWLPQTHQDERLQKYIDEGIRITQKGFVEDFEKRRFGPYIL